MDELVQRAGRRPDKPFADLGGSSPTWRGRLFSALPVPEPAPTSS